jgi:putative transposase
MPRHARFMLADIPVHVIARGHNRAPCFFDAADYQFYLRQLGVLADDFGCALHAYCLMTNHVHLLLTPRTAASCALLMKHLGQRYTQHVNRLYRRSGTLWEGRFRSCLADSEAYLLACYRYVELNPVRAGMVHAPGLYPWSSHRRNAEGAVDRLVTPHERYLALGSDEAARAAAYRDLCEAALDPAVIEAIRRATHGGFALGNARFHEAIARQLGRRVVPGKPGRPAKVDKAQIDKAQSAAGGRGG